MIGRPTGIKLAATFDPFMVVPERAWRQCKTAIIEIMKSYGFTGHIDDVGGQPEAYAAWSREQAAAMDAAKAEAEAKTE